MDGFAAKYLACIRTAQSDDELADIINAIYEDGFQDGTNNTTPGAAYVNNKGETVYCKD